MVDLPLLFFPTPELVSKTPVRGFGGNLNCPSIEEQGKRLGPVFRQLQESFNSRSVELQQTPVGIDPEQVLVIETVGNVEDFANAVKKISGLEWMGEFVLDDISPDEFFYNNDDQNKLLSGRLYLIMSNQQGLKELLSFWQKFMESPKEMNFKNGGEYHGLAKFKDVFNHIKTIRRWNVQDRIEEKCSIFGHEFDEQSVVRFEAELWFRGSHQKQKESEQVVSELIQSLNGRVITQSIIPSIVYHAILGEIPAQSAKQILEQDEVELIKCENIMYFRPTCQMVTGKEQIEGEISDYESSEKQVPIGEPLVALLDGLPLENHRLLTERLIVDDPDNWADDYQAKNRQHGTAMASLIVHGDLNDGLNPLNRTIYVRPIMKPHSGYGPHSEVVPEDILLVDYIHRAVKRIKNGERGLQAVAPSIKIINFSIGDPARHFSQIMSPLARLLDWLSSEYNLLFVISAGNHKDPIDTDLLNSDFDTINSSEREALVIKKIYENERHRKLLSPAESINGLTVGSLHYDSSQNGPRSYLLDIFKSLLPSPFSAFGTGYRRAIKPDLIFSGGRVLFDKRPTSENSILEIRDYNQAPGNQVATPGNQPGELNKSKFSSGTSNSAALISRAGSICYDNIVSIFAEKGLVDDLEIYGVPLVKAMVIHGCSWKELYVNLNNVLNQNKAKQQTSKWIGYGIPELERVAGCHDQRATVIGFGELKDGEAHVYNLPLPPSLSSKIEHRKLTVTLAWLSPIASTTQKYRKAQLWFDFEDGKESRNKLKSKLNVEGIDSDWNMTRRGTIQHEIFEGYKATAIAEGDTLKIKVNCRKDAQNFSKPVAYGLIVSLEVAEGVGIQIYNEIRSRIQPPVPIKS